MADVDVPAPRSIVLVGAGGLGRALHDLVVASPRLHLAAVVARPGASPPWLDERLRCERLDEALARAPDAPVLVALPPRAATEAARHLARVGRRAVVAGPLDDDGATDEESARSEADAGEDARAGVGASVVVLHGPETLPGLEFARRALRHARGEVLLEVRGGCAHEGTLASALTTALVLARLLSPDARPASVERRSSNDLRLDLRADGAAPWQVRIRGGGLGFTLRAGSGADAPTWDFDGLQERVAHGPASARAVRAHVPEPFAARMLRAALEPRGEPAKLDARTGARRAEPTTVGTGAPLDLALQARRLAVALLREAEIFEPIARARLDAAARLFAVTPPRTLDALGLRGEVPVAAPAPTLHARLPAEPLELWSFRAGVKPAVFLTMRPEDEAGVRAACGDAAIERRERRVTVGAQDAWIDRRDRGEPRVELYVSRDPALAKRAAALQAEGDPSALLEEMAELLGYPRCCARAFAEQDDRAHNTRNRYATAARTGGDGPWPAELDNLFLNVVPFYPCRYDCPAALEYARRTLDALAAAEPVLARELRRVLGRAVLYFDHEHQLVFEPPAESGAPAVAREGSAWRLRYGGVAIAPGAEAAFATFAGALAQGDALRFDARALEVARGAEILFTLERTDPALGFVAPFGS